MDAERVARPIISAKACKHCRKKAWVPKPTDVPQPLRQLPPGVIDALRPLSVDSGPYKRAVTGYRIHTAMTRFSWRPRDVLDAIAALQTWQERSAARHAYDFLVAEPTSEYRNFVGRHRAFLRLHPAPEPEVCRRPLRFIEEAGLECAVWPHLYWCSNLCETVERKTDERRLARQGLGPCGDEVEEAGDDDDEDEDFRGRHSIKRIFMRKVLSSVVGYSTDYSLLQFVYDLSLWSRLGGAKNAVQGVPLRIILKGESFSPLYWKTRHLALIDMQKQCGFPTFFKTMAPWEPAFPYHAWVLHEMREACLPRRHLAGPETLHTAHVLTELQRGYYTGMNARNTGRGSRHWTKHLFGNTAGSALPTVLNYFHRLEFQDGKRKLPSQDYHGSGRVHCHNLDYLCNIASIGLETKLRADVPEAESEPVLRGYVLGRPHGRNDSGWPVEHRASRWDGEAKRLRLRHSYEDKEIGNRAYFADTLQVTKCHQDVLHGDGRGLLLKYAATYTPKFSDAFAAEWLNDEASDYSVARRILFDYQPLEPEMWLYLSSKMFPPCRYGGTMLMLRAPWPGMAMKPDWVYRYEACSWRGSDMALLEYLRKSNKAGEIIQWLRRKHAEAATELTLEDFARRQKTMGEKVIAMETYWRMNDTYFGQWLAMNVPFDKLDELLVPDVVEKVPEQYRYLACALHWRQYYWSDEDGIRKDMELEAYRSATIDTFLAMVKANRYLIEKYLSGELYKDDEDRRVAERGCRREAGLHLDSDSDVDALAANDAAGEEMRLNCKQRQLKNCASARMEDSV
ncbi:MAG: hypothetical protein GY772_27090, partial [bacterium]|nr:hypothetical protein [bacterium]